MSTSISFYNKNSAKNALLVEINSVKFYYSYSTCVGVSYWGGTFVRENVWGPTTGKHLNWIDGGRKNLRLNEVTFQFKLAKAKEIAKIDTLPQITF